MKLLNLINKAIFSHRKNLSDHSLGKVLVVSNTGFGDTLLSTPAIKSLRKSFPKQEITFLVNKKFFTLFEDYKYVDNIWKYTGGYVNLFFIIAKCRIKRIHTILLFHSNGPEDIFVSLLSGARNILKWTDNLNHEYRTFFSNTLTNDKKHNIEKKNDLVRYFNPSIIDTTMSVSDRYYEQEGIDYLPKTKKIIGIQIGAQDTYKIWPVKNIIKLSQILIEQNYYVVFFGATKTESQMMSKIENSIKPSNFLNLCCKTKVEELPSILKSLDLLVTNDTGILHLAIAMEVKSLSLFSPTSCTEFGAYQDKELHFSIQKDGFFVNDRPKKQRTQDGMELISVDEVFLKIKEIVC